MLRLISSTPFREIVQSCCRQRAARGAAAASSSSDGGGGNAFCKCLLLIDFLPHAAESLLCLARSEPYPPIQGHWNTRVQRSSPPGVPLFRAVKGFLPKWPLPPANKKMCALVRKKNPNPCAPLLPKSKSCRLHSELLFALAGNQVKDPAGLQESHVNEGL